MCTVCQKSCIVLSFLYEIKIELCKNLCKLSVALVVSLAIKILQKESQLLGYSL